MEKQRKELSSHNKDVLERAYEAGLTSTKKDNAKRIKHLSDETGLSEKQNQSWIGNRRWKEAKSASSKKQKYFPIKRGPSAYTLFTRTIKRGGKEKAQYLKEVADKWKNTCEEEKENFRKEALQCRKNPCQGLDEDDAAKHYVGVLKNACQNLNQIGYNISGILLKAGTVPQIFGSPLGVKFVEDRDLITLFQTTCNQTHEVLPPKKSRGALKEEVRRILNACWEASSGGTKCIPYGKILSGNLPWRLEGLPEGITFKDPSSYNISSLQSILKAKDQLKFIRSNSSPETDDTIVCEQDTEQFPAALPVAGNIEVAATDEFAVASPAREKNKEITGQRKKRKRRTLKQVQGTLEFEVDYLVKDRNDGKEFLVHWKSYREEDRTWEPAEEMPVSSINDYWRKKVHVLSYSKE